MQLPPVMISAPFKILLFVWRRLEPRNWFADERLLRMTPETVIQLVRHALVTALWLRRRCLLWLCRGNRSQLCADPDVHPGFGIQCDSPAAGISYSLCSCDAVDAAEDDSVYGRTLGNLGRYGN